jgi:hypothetical protein
MSVMSRSWQHHRSLLEASIANEYQRGTQTVQVATMEKLKVEIAAITREIDTLKQERARTESALTNIRKENTTVDNVPTKSTMTETKENEKKQQQQQQMDKREQELKSQVNCIVCHERPRDTIIFPCSHFVCCNECASATDADKCPMCRGSIVGNLRASFT